LEEKVRVELELEDVKPEINTKVRGNLLTPSKTYKPFRYPWAYEAWQRQQQIHWVPEEVA
jgi:ribonucleoside-diphosphate reductase beta chain